MIHPMQIFAVPGARAGAAVFLVLYCRIFQSISLSFDRYLAIAGVKWFGINGRDFLVLDLCFCARSAVEAPSKRVRASRGDHG